MMMSVLLRYPSHPFLCIVDDVDEHDSKALRAHGYVL
jgi:hypothetical protein